MNSFTKVIFTLATVAMVTPALAERPARPGIAVGNLATTETPNVGRITQHCAGATACNVLISKCAESDGHWSSSQSDPTGRPTKGACVY